MKALDIGDVMGSTFSVWGRNALPLGAITAVLMIPQILSGLPLLDAMEWLEAADPNDPTIFFTFAEKTFGWSTLMLLTAWIAHALTLGTVAHLSLCTLDGSPRSLSASFKASFRRLPALAGLTLVFNLALGCLCVPFLVVAAFFYPSVPALIGERCSLGAAFSRGALLSEGNRWRCMLIAFLFLFILFAIRLPVGLIGMALPSMPTTLAQMLTLIPSAIGVPLQATAAAVTYHMLLTAREGGRHETLAEVFA